MNDKLICPFCQRKLKTFSKYTDGTSTLYCSKCNLIGDNKLFEELIRTRKALEQSEICCTEWEKQALDYKAENIALSGELDRTRKALEIAVDALKVYANPENWDFEHFYSLDTHDIADGALEQITALEQKDK